MTELRVILTPHVDKMQKDMRSLIFLVRERSHPIGPCQSIVEKANKTSPMLSRDERVGSKDNSLRSGVLFSGAEIVGSQTVEIADERCCERSTLLRQSEIFSR